MNCGLFWEIESAVMKVKVVWVSFLLLSCFQLHDEVRKK